MKVEMTRTRQRHQAGFTLIELLVVVLIIGILAAIAVPQYFKVVEKGRFAEATTCMMVVKGSQERHMLKNNTYAATNAALDVPCPPGKAFTVAGPTWNVTSSAYTATLTRIAPMPAVYGAYVVSFVGPAGNLSCSTAACTADLLP